MILCPVEITLIPVTHILKRSGQLILKDTVIFAIFFPLVLVRLAFHELVAVLAAPTRQKADSRAGVSFIVHNKIWIVFEFPVSLLVDKLGKFKPGCQFD